MGWVCVYSGALSNSGAVHETRMAHAPLSRKTCKRQTAFEGVDCYRFDSILGQIVSNRDDSAAEVLLHFSDTRSVLHLLLQTVTSREFSNEWLHRGVVTHVTLSVVYSLDDFEHLFDVHALTRNSSEDMQLERGYSILIGKI